MQAVVYEGPFNIVVKEKPKPVIIDECDAILKVQLAGICGSDLHMYRGHQETTTGHIMGHEFIGTVEEIGTAVRRFSIGQKVMSIFSPMWKLAATELIGHSMKCWFCEHGYTNRCVNGPSFGSMALDGGQSEYVRVPYAESTLEAIPDEVSDERMIIMCDIFPTGYYGAMKALMKLKLGKETAESIVGDILHTPSALRPSFRQQPLSQVVVVCLGCGPVGVCAVLTAKVLGAGTVYAVDSVEDRLEEARKMGALPLNLKTDDVLATVKSATDGRGADAVVESVGNQSALRLAFDVVRACGAISSIGFHQSELPFSGFEAYSKNIDLNMGRAAVRPVFGEALKVFAENQDKFADFITHRMPLAEAPKAYEIFEKHQARKVILKL
ncbi:chaperonin 10-like protein [Talaromyces proteolyticus]|uniref:Chaperonin 10-like protein n=1 Tax=Talaromyces proteolyticus TaxID=1131652 RepID=A0AAD4KRD6_9EURO|nr:chaperonin 10-like protein [Talaromyces proteolyticus]KAH8697579.1 chaperonin 10-like protein [Talaromyces proteolyticus]